MRRNVVTPAEAFSSARGSISRAACNRWLQVQGVDKDDAAAADQAKQRWQQLPLLAHPDVLALSLNALEGARGAQVDSGTPFPSMIWYGGATDTYAGYRFKGTVGDFVTHVLRARAEEIAPKRCGWVVTPTSSTDGHRVNASTTAVHALNLDCDGRGNWDRLLSELGRLGIAYIAYQSGGWSPSTPKWHILLPLAHPFDTSSTDKLAAWKASYNTARTVFGVVGGLSGEGFDPTVETPCIPIFITERRQESDPPRQVVWAPGHALDLIALIAALPPPEAEPHLLMPPRALQKVQAPLDDDRLEHVVSVLEGPMSKILSGRRDLYLALPGALLDCGLAPDDVLAIVEEISLRCPGDPRYTPSEVNSKHREHMHCAETTIGRYDRGETYSRIGTVHESWPEVARAIDEALPDPNVEALLAKLGQRDRGGRALPPALAAPAPTQSEIPARAVEPAATTSLSALHQQLAKLRNRKLRSKDIEQRIRGVILGALLKGEDLIPYIEPGVPVRDREGRPIDRDRSIAMAMSMVAFKLPAGTKFEALAQIICPSLFAMVREGETLDTLLRVAARTFLKSSGKKIRQDAEEKVARSVYAEKLLRQVSDGE